MGKLGYMQVVKVNAALTPSASGVRLALSAKDLRAEGKAHFQAGRFFDALESYTGCVALKPSASLHCNRALAFMNLYKDARVAEMPEEDRHAWRIEGLRRALHETSVAAIRLQANHPKAFYLAGMARLDLGKLDPMLDPKQRLVMFELALETLVQASELTEDEQVDIKIKEATEELDKTLKHMEELGKQGLLKRPKKEPNPASGEAAPKPKFEPAAAFAGPRPGFVFRTGSEGVGYYEDVAPSASFQYVPKAGLGDPSQYHDQDFKDIDLKDLVKVMD